METIFLMFIVWFFSYAFVEIICLSFIDTKSSKTIYNYFFSNGSCKDKIFLVLLCPFVAILFAVLWLEDWKEVK